MQTPLQKAEGQNVIVLSKNELNVWTWNNLDKVPLKDVMPMNYPAIAQIYIQHEHSKKEQEPSTANG